MTKKSKPEETHQAQKNAPKEVDVDLVDMERLKDKTADVPSILEYAHSLGGFSIVPSKQGVIKGQAMQAMQEQTNMQMDQLYEQMKLLADQAQKIKKRAEISYDIYDANMGFKPLIGKTYYLYKSKKGRTLSMIAPTEWGKSIPFEDFIAEVKLLADHTWKIIEQKEDNQTEK